MCSGRGYTCPVGWGRGSSTPHLRSVPLSLEGLAPEVGSTAGWLIPHPTLLPISHKRAVTTTAFPSTKGTIHCPLLDGPLLLGPLHPTKQSW